MTRLSLAISVGFAACSSGGSVLDGPTRARILHECVAGGAEAASCEAQTRAIAIAAREQAWDVECVAELAVSLYRTVGLDAYEELIEQASSNC